VVRSLSIVMCAGVLNACIIDTKLEEKDFVCGTNDDCVSGYVCFERVCITREEFFSRDAGRAGGSGGGSGTAGGSGGAGGGCTLECPTFDGGPDSGEPDGGEPDAGAPDGGVPDSGVADSGVPDSGTPDAGCDAGTGVEVCGDGIDNNCNAQVDCAELSCAMMSCGLNGRVCTGLMCTCGGGGTPEASELTCNDMRDNDCDGQFDCADTSCSGRTCGANGRTCSGTSCTCSGNGGTAQTFETTCSDTRDNDCDGLTDCADSSCSGRSCGANGRTCSGTSCQCSGNGGTPQTNETTCSDGDDNDCDGLADCADTQCAGQSCGANGRTCAGTSCTCSGNGGTAQATETSCSDGFDNDCDGLADAMDPSCMTAGPDGGYTSGTSPQVFVDACSQAGSTRHTFGDADDDVTPVLALPFAFDFYGVPVTQYWVTTNGYLGFGGSTNLTTNGNCLPSPFAPRPGIYADLDDLISTNGLCTAVTGTAPNRKLVITWPNMSHFNYGGVSFTFSVLLSETTKTIDLVYSTMTGTAQARGIDAVVGMQNGDGSRFNELACFQSGYLMTGLAIRFTPN